MSKQMTTPLADGFRMPGEFEQHRGTLLIWPKRQGSWNYGAKEAREAFSQIISCIADSENVYLLAFPEDIPDAMAMVSRSCERAEETKVAKDITVAEETKQKKECIDCQSCEGMLTLQDSFLQKEKGKIFFIPMESDDAWARDVGPTCVKNEQGEVCGIDWKFNAWGGSYDGLYANWDRDDKVAEQFCQAVGLDYYDAHPFVLEGGSIHSDGEGTLLVTEACLLSKGRNPELTKQQIEERLKNYLGVEKIIWLPFGIYQDETNEHVDNVCAFTKPGEVVLAWTDDESDPQYAMSRADYQVLSTQTDARGRSFTIHKLPIPKNNVCITQKDLEGFVFEEGEDQREVGERLAASYVNFYISNGGILVPQFGDEMDARAVAVLKQCFPQRRIYPIAARAIIVGGGNIHCITQQIL